VTDIRLFETITFHTMYGWFLVIALWVIYILAAVLLMHRLLPSELEEKRKKK